MTKAIYYLVHRFTILYLHYDPLYILNRSYRTFKNLLLKNLNTYTSVRTSQIIGDYTFKMAIDA